MDSNVLTLVFGLMATILGIGAIWATRRYNHITRNRNNNIDVIASDVELGLLHRSFPTVTPGDEPDNIHPVNISPDHRDIAHQIIGDALEVFSRHLRRQD